MTEHRAPKDVRETPRQKLSEHRGLATWGEKLVPLARFREAVAESGRALSPQDRTAARAAFLATPEDPTPVEGPFSRVAVFGGVYSNSFALGALLEDAERRGAEAVYCLGDLGGFGPHPEKIWSLIHDGGVAAIQGNYEQSLASGAEDCNCGYTDPRDNHFAEISYSYTARSCSADFKRWMGSLPTRRRVQIGDQQFLLVHGSPRRVNEFLFFSTTPVAYLETVLDQEACDGFLCTHTGLQWRRRLPSGRDVVNVGVIGRPANDGALNVWYCILDSADGGVNVELVPLDYDYPALARDMRREGLPDEFVETITSGWWTTCLEILPARERALSKF